MSTAKERVEYLLRNALNSGKTLDDSLSSITSEWQADKDETQRLREAIEKAPHEKVCPVSMYWEHNWEGDVNCTCWKRDALKEVKA